LGVTTVDADEQFLAAMRTLERALHERVGDTNSEPLSLYDALNEALDRRLITGAQRRFLDECRLIRNRLVHGKTDGWDGYLVHVEREVVVRLNRLLALLAEPVPVSRLARPADTCEPTDELITVLELMREKDYSQVPYRSSSGGWMLFTRDQVARWVEVGSEGGHALVDLHISVGDATGQPGVGEIHAPKTSANTPAIEAIQLLRPDRLVPPLGFPALIVTGMQGGRLGILTAADLPAAWDLLNR
jgi:hypothetical protein